MTERWQNGAMVALRFFARKCRNHMISGENQQKMAGKSAERAEISAEMRVFLNSAQKIRRTEIFAERRTAQNAEREPAKTGAKTSTNYPVNR
jgi:hypothetical protein